MPVELSPEEDRPGVPIAPPLLFVFPIIASLALEWFFPTSFAQGPIRWIFGALIFLAGIALAVSGFVTQKRAGTDPIPFNPSTRIVAHGLYRFIRNPMYSEERYLERKFGEEYLNYKRRVRRWI